jgi:hypothetical protein
MTSGKRTAVFALVLAATAIGAAGLPAAAQPARTDDVLAALLIEMKGLRVATEQMASGGAQAQLLVGRLQVQETRLTAMIQRLDDVRDRLSQARTEYDLARDSLKMQEKYVGHEGLDGVSAADRDAVLQETKAQVAAAKTRVDALAADEMQIAGDAAIEQQRWIAINQRLEELERALAKR